MSFSSDIKTAILMRKSKNRCCRHAFAVGIIAASASLEGDALTVLVGSRALALGIADAVRDAYPGGREPEVVKSGSFLFFVRVYAPSAVKYLRELSENPDAPVFTPRCKDCRAAFLRGIFVGCGRVSDPAKGYHLEFSCGGRADRLYGIFSRLGLDFRYTKRNHEELYYVKSSSAIQDFFGMIGENEAYFDLMNARIERELRNSANRIATCEANNITKAVNAAGEQLAAIGYLADAHLLESLPTELAATARLRLENPTLSLAQLAAISVPPISKPGLSHRLRRLVEISEKYRTRPEKDPLKKV